ncbi:MAG: hypothetical protein KAT56_10815, partial [Sedimentisphaerales bacterium]|nr:hypothetical protein [Sedimentisphaerales bacterium]
MKEIKEMTMAVIVANRGFFPDSLVRQGRSAILDILKGAGYNTVILDENDTKYGAVETLADARKCADLFSRHAHEIDGVIVTLPNFGDEKGVLEVIKSSGLNVPILIQAEPDEPDKMS